MHITSPLLSSDWWIDVCLYNISACILGGCLPSQVPSFSHPCFNFLFWKGLSLALQTLLPLSSLLSCSQNDILKMEIFSDHSPQTPLKPSISFKEIPFVFVCFRLYVSFFFLTFSNPTAVLQFLKLHVFFIFLLGFGTFCSVPNIPNITSRLFLQKA